MRFPSTADSLLRAVLLLPALCLAHLPAAAQEGAQGVSTTQSEPAARVDAVLPASPPGGPAGSAQPSPVLAPAQQGVPLLALPAPASPAETPSPVPVTTGQPASAEAGVGAHAGAAEQMNPAAPSGQADPLLSPGRYGWPKASEALLDHGSAEGIKERVTSRLSRAEADTGRRLTLGIGVLATIGATAPFVGLFGTVWGIMNSFIGIAETQTTNLAVVAPGIAEALLATGIGLVAAIPAVIIYNAFARSIAGYRLEVANTSAVIERLVSRDIDLRRISRTMSLAHAAE